MNHRQYLIDNGLIRPSAAADPDGPTPQAWRDEPTVRLEPKMVRVGGRSAMSVDGLKGVRQFLVGTPWQGR